MKDSFLFRINPLLAAAIVVGALFAILFGLYGITRLVSEGEVMGHVEVSGIPLGGLTEDQVSSTLVAVEDAHLGRRVYFTVEAQAVDVNPPETGFDIDEDLIVSEAMAVGREGNASFQFLFWLTNIFSTTELDLVGSVDQESMDAIFDDWDQHVIGQPASLGAAEGSEAAVKEKVIEAHRVLMELSPENRARFKDLLTVLERS